jgi:hypothetical protein
MQICALTLCPPLIAALDLLCLRMIYQFLLFQCKCRGGHVYGGLTSSCSSCCIVDERDQQHLERLCTEGKAKIGSFRETITTCTIISSVGRRRRHAGQRPPNLHADEEAPLSKLSGWAPSFLSRHDLITYSFELNCIWLRLF